MHRAQAFLQQQGIEMPRRKFVEGFGTFGADDAALGGTMAGLLIASRSPRPWAVTGRTRWVGAAAYGASASWLFFCLYLNARIGPQANNEKIRRTMEAQIQAKQWSDQVNSAFQTSRKGGKESTASPAIPTALRPIPQAQRIYSDGQPSAVKELPPVAVPVHEKIGSDGRSWSNDSNLPHLTSDAGSLGPGVPYANTNYTWTPTPGKAITELEAHISTLRRRREDIACESELVWRWLAEKEIEYYGLDADAGPYEKTKRRRYLEVLGNIHTKVWVEASKCDWMIADSQKRIEQLRSAAGTPDGKVTWLPPLSTPAPAAESHLSEDVLKASVKLVQARKQAVEGMRTELSTFLKQPDAVPKEGRTQSSLTGKWVDNAQALQDLIKRVELDTANATLDAEALEGVLKDVERRRKDVQKRG
ncbi:hypothetical protein LTR37_002646 [Vermiconidia calcicola]|uniref:Uncharacterized protein n=1 Tax=Vermiconidia calcicola TaxID=1690605 RepID=A0ACC3NSV9_9PEZI|nr:hypothetical protein LTR37_002646 [Vermiconidia calcicola]